MRNDLTISVCMTAFSQSNYLKEQLRSILNQSIRIDELVVFEDFSGKESPKKYFELLCHKENLKLIYKTSKKNIGPAESFQQAIKASTGDIIFLSDHDDIWHKDRIRKTLSFHKNYDLIVVNGQKFETTSDICESGSRPYNKIYHNLKFNLLRLILRNEIIGATMSMKGNSARLLASRINFYPMHDWVMVIAFLVLNKKVKFLDLDLIQYRRHEHTFTGNKKNNLLTRIKFRFLILYTILRVFMFK